jgi:hypothetical protein
MVGTGISRTSFPVFIGPRDPEPMRVPEGIDPTTVYHKGKIIIVNKFIC